MNARCDLQKKRIPQLRKVPNPITVGRARGSGLDGALFFWGDSCVADQRSMVEALQQLHRAFLDGEHYLMMGVQGLLHGNAPQVRGADW